MKHDERFLWLDLVRGLSALAVVAGHLRAAIFVDYSPSDTTTFSDKLFYAVTALGHEAVMVFFVLSGFFVGGSILRRGQCFRWPEYALARLTRLWVVLIPALLFTAFVDYLIGASSPEVLAGSYYRQWSSGPSSEAAYSLITSTFVANVFFLQTIVAPVYGSNSPLWSLANEFWYYALFPMFVYALNCTTPMAVRPLSARLFFGTLAAGIFLLMPPGIQKGFFVWLMGVAVYYFSARQQESTFKAVILGCILFLLSVALSKTAALQPRLGDYSDLIVGFGFSFLCFGMAFLRPPAIFSGHLVRLARGLSEISYSLYLSHFPVVLLIAATFYGAEQLTPGGMSYGHFFAWLMLLILVALGFWWLFEKRTEVVRKLLSKHPLICK